MSSPSPAASAQYQSSAERALLDHFETLKASDGAVGPGYILIEEIPLTLFKKQFAGKILLPTGAITGEKERQQSQYGVIVQCSPVYMLHQGQIVGHEVPEDFVYKDTKWPLKPGQVVCVRNTVPWQEFGAFRRVYLKPVDLLHIWPVGEKPAFL